MTTSDGSVLNLWEGGGLATILRYGCEPAFGGRALVSVSASLNWDTGIYTGERITYSVNGGVATETSRTPAVGPRDAQVFQLDWAACA